MLWECILRTSAFTLAVWLVSLFLRRQSAAVRHSLWMCALGAFLLIPALFPLSQRTPALRVPTVVDTSAAAFPTVILQPANHPYRAARWNRNRALQALWLLGTVIVCLRRSRAALRMKRIAARSVAWSTEPGVRTSDEVRAPLTWGLIRPMILLPATAVDWPNVCLRSVLLHEREHIRRSDSLSHWLGELICAAWWFHPLAWLARSQAGHERECACDDAVLRSGIRPSDYSTELLNLISTLPAKGETLMALSVLSRFEKRIRQILLNGIDRRPVTARARTALALAAFAVIVPLSILRAQAPAGQGDLSGTVADPSDARVPNALITASGSSGNREVTHADAAGMWLLSGVPAGTYTVEVEAPGFALATNTVTVEPGQHATMMQKLRIGSVRQRILVVAAGQSRHTDAQVASSPEPIRVGGSVQATKLLRQVRPAYPASAQAQGIEGTVLLNAVIGKDGDLLSLAVLNKLIDPDLAAASLHAVQQWHYQPTLLNGVPVEVVTTITVNFKLQM